MNRLDAIKKVVCLAHFRQQLNRYTIYECLDCFYATITRKQRDDVVIRALCVDLFHDSCTWAVLTSNKTVPKTYILIY